jgi:hypothetical protein
MTTTHFTAWLATSPSVLDSDDCDITVLADDAISHHMDDDGAEGDPIWSSVGDPILHALTGIPASADDHPEAQRTAEQVLAEAGWRTTGTWEPVDTGYIITVERDDDNETWTLQEAAAHMGTANTNTAQRALKRLGVESVGRAPGRGGQNLYLAAEVMYAHAIRPGQGARTDLSTPQ